jgi:hypothetical protein
MKGRRGKRRFLNSFRAGKHLAFRRALTEKRDTFIMTKWEITQGGEKYDSLSLRVRVSFLILVQNQVRSFTSAYENI